MILQLSGLCRGLLRDSCKASTRSRGKTSTGWALGVRSHTCAFSSSLQQRYVANQHDDQGFQSSCWSVLSSSPSSISSSISTFQNQKTSIPLGRIPLLAILLTPAHIGLSEETAEFIPNVLRHTFDVLKDGQKIDVLAAVVDRIPYPTSARPANWTDHQSSAEVAPPGTQIEDGSEGMSFAVLDSNSAAPDLWSARAESRELSTMPIQQRCTLSFAFPLTAVPVPVSSDGKERTQPLVSRVLQLPVANTLFKNGKTSTLIAQRWRSQGIAGSSCALSCIQKAKLPQQTLHLTDVFSDQSIGLSQSLHSHLMPITPTRAITAAIGNIIRRISVDDRSTEGVPASEELEKAISAAIKDGRIPSEQAGIWALVRPPNYPFPGQPSGNLGGAVTHEIQQAVLTGCQLRKVLSGGGGWGEKQGLLALDPDSNYHISQQAFGPSYWEDQGVEPKKMQPFGELVNPGDTVKFFVHRSPQISESISEAFEKNDSVANLIPLSLRFGSLPSNMDAMPIAPINETDSSSQPSCMVIKHHFGMLSEQGMSLESKFLETDLRASKAQYLVPTLLGRGLPPFEVLDELVLTTKLDAPYMTWSIEEDIQAVDPTTEVDLSRPPSLSEYAHNGTPKKRTRTGIDALKSTMTRSHEAKLETLDDFEEAMSTMPSHQHVATIGPHPRDRRQVEVKAGGKTYTKGLAIGQEVAKLWGRPGKQLIRKFEHEGLEAGAASVPLTKFSQVQSHIHSWVKRSRAREDAIEHLQRHDTNTYQSDKIDIAHISQQPPGVKSEEKGARGKQQPEHQVHRNLRIQKHKAKLPSVMTQRLARSVRSKIILETLLSEEDDMVAEKNLAGSDSEEQLETPMAESAIETAPMEQRTRPEQLRRYSDTVICEVVVGLIRKYHGLLSNGKGEHHSDQTASYNSRIPTNRKEGLLDGMKARRLPKSKEGLMLMDPTRNHSPAYKKLQNKPIRKHLSHGPPPMNARDKAKKLHEEYHLPLLDECPDDAPRP